MRVLLVPLTTTQPAGYQALLKAGEPILQLEEKDLLLYLDGQAVRGGDRYRRVHFHEGAELGITVFHVDPSMLKGDGSLFSRHAYVRDGDVIRDSPADVEVWLHAEDDHVDGFREALDVGLEHHVLLVLRLLEVKQVDVLGPI